jgi:hypothetical protein
MLSLNPSTFTSPEMLNQSRNYMVKGCFRNSLRLFNSKVHLQITATMPLDYIFKTTIVSKIGILGISFDTQGSPCVMLASQDKT